MSQRFNVLIWFYRKKFSIDIFKSRIDGPGSVKLPENPTIIPKVGNVLGRRNKLPTLSMT